MAYKLGMFYLGGGATGANLELHDLQFVAVETVEQAYPRLRQAWVGDKHKLHLDGYSWITWADGYAVSLSKSKPEGRLKLFFVNVGGYRQGQLAELHEFALFVAETPEQAKQKALEQLLPGADLKHKDNLKAVEHCLLLELFDQYYVHLTPDTSGQPDLPAWQGYHRL
ncbi:hypothetical protein AKN87_00550 [Thiopseudomonas alkaliphila]|uniref:DUF1543 domain-containing protein n=1 Tax=Thiopseudomonas alkaliphila TaxID=1697053 RepID=UPI00069EE16B|nr:DUF1543 domain-containing protein [Thiopseudomonas alkaliphila]AKX43768.1 hypothetical protein AKN87_00550 [Thiopseudomonas alkaliphila]AKX46023.1 hypothetical protein AKN94_00560 [Thiopseudomonas alkaliphila]AKX49107.1 hypothetical protein AKN93_06590 [Thiopseudomonas alkaliphila]AKX51801.1 hypothetical protein AKN92_10150 [Thiopseudomonas alkaliphila]AKX52997.1 hypothetical protein AKN91_04410 [Thiopseudomonas alkaliphila]